MNAAERFWRLAAERHRLSPRQAEVCWLTLRGVTRREEQATILGIAPSSVDEYRQVARRKLAVESNQQLVMALWPLYVAAGGDADADGGRGSHP